MNFELANVLVALGGDRRNVVPKVAVTAPEIAVLCAIHGEDAVHDIQPLDDTVERTAKTERERLLMQYPAKGSEGDLVVMTVYPGVTPLMHDTLESLGLGDELYKAVERAKPKAKPKTAAKKPAAKKAAAPKPEPVGAGAEAPDGDVTEMFD